MELTEAQRTELDPAMVMLSDALEAKKAGDMETYLKLFRAIPMPSDILLRLKRCGHKDFIQTLNTSIADAEYGPGWLDDEDRE